MAVGRALRQYRSERETASIPNLDVSRSGRGKVARRHRVLALAGAGDDSIVTCLSGDASSQPGGRIIGGSFPHWRALLPGVGEMALYESDHTKFMREMMAQHPEWAEDQRRGRAIWWDRKVDLDEQKAQRQASEPHLPYPYDVNFEQR
jgi:hypothetical protein